MKFKKLLIYSLIILSFFVLNKEKVFATSGACSYHGGVNCDISGLYATCNDGTESSVFYSDMDECVSNYPNTYTRCSIPIPYCSQDALNNYRKIHDDYVQGCKVLNSRLGGNIEDCTDSSGTQQINYCQSQINLYQQAQEEYKQCLQQGADLLKTYEQNKADNSCLQQIGLNSHFDNTCVCNTGYTLKNNQCVNNNTINNNDCKQQHGLNSFFNTKNQSCQCNDGYGSTNQNPQCLLISNLCDKDHIYNSADNKCECKFWNEDFTTCKISINTTSSTEVKTPTPADESLIIQSRADQIRALGKANIKPSENINTPAQQQKLSTNYQSTTTEIVSTTSTPATNQVISEPKKEKDSFWKKILNFFFGKF